MKASLRIDCCGNLYTGLLLCDAAIINFKMCVEKIEGIVKEKPMATKKKILYIVEAMGGGVFTYIVDLANELVDTYDMYIAYSDRGNFHKRKKKNVRNHEQIEWYPLKFNP